MSDLDKKILEAIASRRLTPTPYAYFLARRSVFRTLAILSVVLGAVSVAVAIFAIKDLSSTGGRGLDEMPLDDVLVKLPFVWAASLALLVMSALYSIRQTPNGYRLSSMQIVSGALFASLVLGGLLSVLGIGEATDRLLRDRVPVYDRLTRSLEILKNDPAGGFLAGRILSIDKHGLKLLDFDGQTWTVDFGDASIDMTRPVATDEDVAVTGAKTGPATFRAVSIRDWD